MQIKEFESGLDWVTLSSKSYSEYQQQFLKFSRSLQAELLANNRGQQKEVRAAGYHGVKIGPVQFKQRGYDKHCLIQAEGKASESLLERVLEQKIPYKVTRIDGQATIRLDTGDKGYITEIARTVRQFRQEKRGDAAQVMGQFTDAVADTGITLGSRSSAVYCRIYDYARKHLATSNFDLWRFEVEAKDVAVDKFLYEYINSSNRPKTVAGIVKQRMSNYGIDLSAMGDLEPIELSGTKPASEKEVKLKYLESTVLPFLARLIEEGAADEVVDSLKRNGFLDDELKWASALLGPRYGYPTGD